MNKHRDLPALLTYLMLIGVTSFLLSRAGGVYALLVLAAIYAASFLTAKYTKLTKNELGLEKKYALSGLLEVIPLVFIILAMAITAFIVDPNLFQDQRYRQGFGEMLLMVLVLIPLKTVLIEELIFRGVLLGLLNRRMTQVHAVIGSALVFSLWHVFSAGSLRVSNSSSAVDVGSEFLSVAGVLIVTFCGGLLFGWLRMRKNSLFAPILIHWFINSVGVLLAYLAWNI